jgi:Mor family transcriptional regulator
VSLFNRIFKEESNNSGEVVLAGGQLEALSLTVHNVIQREVSAIVRSEMEPIIAMMSTFISRLDEQVEIVQTIKEHAAKTEKKVNTVMTKEIYGKKAVFLPQGIKEAKKLTNSEIRSLIHKAAKGHPGGNRKGYTHIYNKLKELTGVDVYEIGQIALGKKDGIEGWSKDPSYINAILKNGIQVEAAVIAQTMITK